MNPTLHLLTHQSRLLLSRPGRFSSMLDMGGMATANANTRIDVGKNNKVRAVALDFHLITRSIEQRRREAEDRMESAAREGDQSDSSKLKPLADVQPDITLVEKMANLLNIKLGDSSPVGLRQSNAQQNNDSIQDLSSTLLGTNSDTEKKATPQPLSSVSSPHLDIRSKYASKLRNKIDGGVAGIDLMNYEKEEAMRRGDASSHLAAKTLLSSHADDAAAVGSGNTSSSRWLATTGVGKLLSFLTSRSMQIVLLPIPSTPNNPQTDGDAERTLMEMNSLTKQLPHVHFDLLVSDGRRRGGKANADNDAAQDILQYALSKLEISPIQYVVVSDRDDYLRAARESSMFTCRVRPKNVRRGEVTASYNVEDVGGVEGVINEINGISFNSSLKR
ncbi:hypothetical protein HJC23_011346 [Cyclotella cryptica]|uniref:Uncharacterized protein n=1 Tax=Cyclotella cryptica TaxID=29204 RepID=A0ABD3QW27_9STRA|eukprot:CCRYP_001750-RA/>CCRYP_001750-RA protein AED:0.00 eAED:0.00 QI:194/-1/1/1/-1/1/1/199/389